MRVSIVWTIVQDFTSSSRIAFDIEQYKVHAVLR